MFTLRTVFDENKVRNNYLGNDYEIFNRSKNFNNTSRPLEEDEFLYYFNDLFKEPEINDRENVMAIISNGEKLIPLYRSHTYYIVTEKGKTFSKFSWSNPPKEI